MKKRNIAAILIITISIILIWIIVRYDPADFYTSISSSGGRRADPEPPLLLDISTIYDGHPASTDSVAAGVYSGYHLLYNEEYEQAAWVVYILTKNMILAGTTDRTENFRIDTMIATGSASPRDYLRSGFDRGHLAPAGDMKWSHNSMSESFLMSNMSPQVPAFNRGVWNRLESKVRDWAIDNDSLLVITGPVFGNVTEFIGENRVGVPKHYFKIIADISPPNYKTIAFLLENSGSSASLFSFVVTVDSIEMLTGYDFFATQPNQQLIDRMESRVNIMGWER
jgi:endonuclease G, mitochondrial